MKHALLSQMVTSLGMSIAQPECQNATFLSDGCLICQKQRPKLVIIQDETMFNN